jgi:hypothetical protein
MELCLQFPLDKKWIEICKVNGLLLLHLQCLAAWLPPVGPEPVPSWARSTSPQLVCDACDGLSGPQLFSASCPESATFFFVFLRNSCQSQHQVSPVMSSVLTDRLVWGNTGFARPSPSECYYPPRVGPVSPPPWLLCFPQIVLVRNVCACVCVFYPSLNLHKEIYIFH